MYTASDTVTKLQAVFLKKHRQLRRDDDLQLDLQQLSIFWGQQIFTFIISIFIAKSENIGVFWATQSDRNRTAPHTQKIPREKATQTPVSSPLPPVNPKPLVKKIQSHLSWYTYRKNDITFLVRFCRGHLGIRVIRPRRSRITPSKRGQWASAPERIDGTPSGNSAGGTIVQHKNGIVLAVGEITATVYGDAGHAAIRGRNSARSVSVHIVLVVGIIGHVVFLVYVRWLASNGADESELCAVLHEWN